ncbi:MAG: TetR/AcrR family transcriptional regulator [Steroidobacteraceae bacterium]
MQQPARADRRETYHRFMDAAELIFIRYGYEGASIRMISREADAPLGTLHHYWGSKEVLFRDTCERRFGPILAQQSARISECERRAAAGEKLDVATLARALVEPPILSDGHDGSSPESETIRMLYGRVFTEPSEVVRRIVKDLFGPTSLHFHRLMRELHPQIDDTTFYWRFTCVIGALIFAQSFGDRVVGTSDTDIGPIDWRRVVDEIVGVMVRGLAG